MGTDEVARTRALGAAPTAGIEVTVGLERAPLLGSGRVTANGKQLLCDGERFAVWGVTYGSFLPRADGALFPERDRLREDLEAMASLGLNTVRVYTTPPAELLDIASEVGLHVLVGIDFRDWRWETAPSSAVRRRVRDAGRRAVDEALERCAGRAEVLALSVGNEVPADVVRVHGIGAVQDVLSELAAAAHDADGDLLVTYTSFPTTEFLQVEGIDLACFNVFLEDAAALRRYLRHLQLVSGSLPLVVTELGLASGIHGEEAQARSLDAQLRVVDECGCAGATVFAWTDEWGVDGRAVEGWGFGITGSDRTPKAASAVVQQWAGRSLKDLLETWPRISVVVCAYNEERTIEQCLASLERCNYPDLEVVVCDDGSSDRTLELARRFPFEVLALPHGGLSAARNAGIAAATGDIVAFLDADAACIPEWPWRLALSFDDANVAASGGPNLPFREAGLVERAVSYSPGSAREVLVTDDRAEHVPGCNMAFRRDALLGVGCFDPVYTSAGDDVDVCWKLLDEGREIAFSAAAEVHHHRRATVRGYFRQQRGYGRAEKLLWSRHRHRFNRLGQASWNGFIYGPVRLLPSLLRPVIYHGHQGRAPFQPVMVRRSESVLAWAGALLPLLAPVSAVGGALALFSPVWWLVPAVAIAIVSAYGTAVAMATPVERGEPEPLKLRVLVGALHVAQPFVRTWGRLQQRTRRAGEPRPAPWSGDRASWLHDLERLLRWRGATVRSGSAMDGWDLEVGTGPFVRMRITTAVAWRWVPQYAMRLRVTLAAWLLAAGAVTVGLLGRSGGRPIAGVLLASIGAESSFLRKRVRRVLEMTTSGARHDRTGARQVGKSGEP